MIRRASVFDIPEILKLGRDFFDYGPWAERTEYVESDLERSLKAIIEGDGAIFLSDDGMCGGLIFPLYFNLSHKIAQELFWFAPTDGTALRQSYEQWAKDNGARDIQMTCLCDGREKGMRRLLGAKGYSVIETSFLRRI